MTMWRCPHCGTPQAETARCWVCRRSSTACGTCRDFRRAVAGSLGFCANDRRRSPLAGDEIRPCWQASDTQRIAPWAHPDDRPVAPLPMMPRGFVEVDAPTGGPAATPGEPRWSLWGDPDR